MRLKLSTDRTYLAPRATFPLNPAPKPTGDFDGDMPIGEPFMAELRSTGKAKTSFRKSDVAK